MEPLKLEDLSAEQRIGQMLFARMPRKEQNRRQALRLIRDHALGGLQLGPEQEADEFLAAADYPLLISDNMESGYEGPGAVALPCQQAIGAVGDEQAAYEWARIAALDAKAAGRNTVFGPILDVGINPLSCCVGPRSFGAEAEHVARLSAAAVRGYQDQGLVVTGKHFPGFGESAVDSHIGMVYLRADEPTLRRRDLLPYIRCIEQADLSGIMTGHIIADAIDPETPATLSKKVVDYLRDLGFDGLVLIDSLAMIGLTNLYGLPRCHEMAMAAGNDMILTSYRLSPDEAYEMMLAAYRKGAVTDEQVDAAVRRVLAAQRRTMKPADGPPGDAERRKAAELSRRSITAVTTGGASAGIDPAGEHLFLVQVGNTFTDPETGEVHTEGDDPAPLLECIGRLFPNARTLQISDFPSREEMERACVATADADSVVALCRSRTKHYMGSSDLTRRMLSLLDGIVHRLSAVVVFGNAYASRELPRVPRLILGYEGGDAELAALEALAGRFLPQGNAPVDIG
jgi:beta-N-acetylhexosaminidase